MPAESVKLRLQNLGQNVEDLRQIRILVDALVVALRTLTLKLDADATVTDTDYTAVLDAIVVR